MSNIDKAAQVLLSHQRTWSGPCTCGWGYLGASFSEHQVQMLTDAEVLVPDDAEVTTEYGNEYVTGVIKPSGPKEYAEWVAERHGYTLYRRTVHHGEWQEVRDA